LFGSLLAWLQHGLPEFRAPIKTLKPVQMSSNPPANEENFMKRVLVLWAKHSATNLGIRVLAAGAAHLCEMAFGDVEVDFHDHDTIGTPLGKSPIIRDFGRANGDIKSLFRKYDVVMDTTSGDSFTDIYGARRLSVMTYAHHAAIKSGVPLVLAPQTIGPFDSSYGRMLARGSVRRATRVYARDSESAAYCTALGRKPDALSSDLVFALPPLVEPSGRAGAYLNVSGLLWRPNPHVDHNTYRRHVLGAARMLAEHNYPVTLFPHVLRSDVSREDDVTAVEQAADELKDAATTCVPESLDDMRTRLSSAALVVGARMHACLNALAVGTPALAWAYSRKFAPLLNDLGWGGSIDLRTSEDIVGATSDFVRELDSWSAKAPTVRDEAFHGIERVAENLAEVV
jgi:polysaccharide pyruvyl transferase WcaK-like protein